MGKGNGQPHGGFVFVSAAGLLATWWSYKAGLIEFRDVRAWLACHELKARRCTLEKGRLPRYSEPELGRLIGGVGGEHVRVTLRRLQSASLVTWSSTSIDLRTTTESLPSDAVSFVESVRNHRRRIPVPRPLVRLLARERRPVLVATALGHLLRCMYFRKGQCEPLGLCKSSWVAEVFGVDERNVKAARSELEAKGVLVREQTPQLVMNRHGLAVRINLDWPGAAVESPPRTALSTTQSPRPRETGISSSRRSENQKLGAPSPSGVRKRTGRGPNLSRVTREDLGDPNRLCRLFQQAQARGWVGRSEAERLKFFAAAEHARRFARRSAEGLFVSVVKHGLWHHLTLADEDTARMAVRTLDTVGAVRRGSRVVVSARLEDESVESIRERVRRSLESVGALE
jgi:hypothetical protein